MGVIGGPIRTRLLRRLGPIIHLPDLEIQILLPAHAMPPAIHIMCERPRPHLAKAVELGPRQGWEPARETTEGSP